MNNINKIQYIINSSYILPSIIDHIDNPTSETSRLMHELDLGQDLDLFKHIIDLLKYHKKIVEDGFESSNTNYDLLRKGLKQFFNECLYNVFDIVGLKNTFFSMLDYGCGDGQYADEFLRLNPDGDAWKLDREVQSGGGKHIAVDFERTPQWWVQFQSKFDLVLLSEVLHCKNDYGKLYLVESSKRVLKTGGCLMVIENDDPFMNYRLSKIRGIGYGSLNEGQIDELIIPAGFDKIMVKPVAFYHKVYIYEKL